MPKLEDLVSEVLGSKRFSRSVTSSALLKHLHDNPGEANCQTRIALKPVFGNKDVFLPQKISGLNRLLDDYYNQESADSSDRIRVLTESDEGYRKELQYDVVMLRNVQRDMIESFWRPYLVGLKNQNVLETVLAYGLPLFMTDEGRNMFFRDVSSNVPEDYRKRSRKGYVVPAGVNTALEWEPIYTFITEGEAMCAVKLTNFLARREVRIKPQWHKREDNMGDLLKAAPANSNVILLGTTRACGIHADYDEPRFPAEANDHGIGFKGKRPHLRDSSTLHVLVTRRKGVHDEASTITLIASTSGRAIDGVGSVLVDAEEMRRVVGNQPPFQDGRWPREFQLLFSVEVRGRGTAVANVRLLEKWSIPESRRSSRKRH